MNYSDYQINILVKHWKQYRKNSQKSAKKPGMRLLIASLFCLIPSLAYILITCTYQLILISNPSKLLSFTQEQECFRIAAIFISVLGGILLLCGCFLAYRDDPNNSKFYNSLISDVSNFFTLSNKNEIAELYLYLSTNYTIVSEQIKESLSAFTSRFNTFVVAAFFSYTSIIFGILLRSINDISLDNFIVITAMYVLLIILLSSIGYLSRQVYEFYLSHKLKDRDIKELFDCITIIRAKSSFFLNIPE
ncbi:hypothetical protein [Lancefieldella rimae]|uniref:hypothetical protein n=1 Tax=Lancefieldella rimae TaxID=1383 RepID=UPI0028E64FD2|nr:hypothetical protein [Lancefieldella rimae]